MPKLSLTAPMEKIKKKKVKIQTLNGSKIMISGKVCLSNNFLSREFNAWNMKYKKLFNILNLCNSFSD